MSEEIAAGHFKVISCLLENYDRSKKLEIYGLVASFRITEGMSQVAMSATMAILDTQNLIDDFPLQGEEFVTFTIGDFYGTEKTYEFQVYAISPVEQDYASKKLTYSLALYTKDFLKTESTEIRRSYLGPIKRTAETIFDEYFSGDKPLDIETTDGTQTIVIPALTPFESLVFLARKAYTEKSPSATFRFFETRDDFKFVTYEELIARVDTNALSEDKIYTYYDPKLNNSTPAFAMQNLIDYKVTRRFNLLNEMRQGGMISRSVVLDLSKKTIEEPIYKHYESRSDQESVDENQRPLHSSRFIQDHFSDDNVIQSYIVFKDTTKPESYYESILPRRMSSNYYLNSIGIYAKAYGSFKINVGDIIQIDLPRPGAATGNVEEHDTYSGFYIVESLNHTYELGGDWKVEMNLIKDALKGSAA